MQATAPFLDFLRKNAAEGGFQTENILAAILPLMEQVRAVHAQGMIAPLEGTDAIQVDGAQLWFDEAQVSQPRKHLLRIIELQKASSISVGPRNEAQTNSENKAGALAPAALTAPHPNEDSLGPTYLCGYACWEHRYGHHDQLTDIFCLGLILASLACGLDLTDEEDFEKFVAHRENLFELNPRLNPVIASVIVQMTQLNRRERVQDLESVIRRLRRHRDQANARAIDFSQLPGFRESSPTQRGKIVLTHLRNRLFEITRRNRLIYFQSTLQSLNLTVASAPLRGEPRNIKSSELLTWNDEFAAKLARSESLILSNHLNFDDVPYIAEGLDRIIANVRKDCTEFGFAQLRLVLCFLRWHNLKENAAERIHSPLLLLPVELTRKKGVRDTYVLKPLSTEAEVNPALRYYLRQIYGLNLPEAVDISKTNLHTFHHVLAEQIRASEPAVVLNKVERPVIASLQKRAQQRAERWKSRDRLRHRDAELASLDASVQEPTRLMGLQLFQGKVDGAPAAPAGVRNGASSPLAPTLVTDAKPALTPEEAEQNLTEGDGLSESVQPATGNPYEWEFDLCNVTLGNFNYRKMSLVQDYSTLLERDLANRPFDSIFSSLPRKSGAAYIATLPMADQFHVVDCDPTQRQAVARGRLGESYIIQGPPGTGKSQTITNLIADYTARGKRVLFVCEKRAAIDVVYHRLASQGLTELCCLIYDSQTDKKAFVQNLKETYESFLSAETDGTIDARRTALIRLIEQETAALERWSNAMQAAVPQSDITVRELIARLIELRSKEPSVHDVVYERIPGYELWKPHAATVRLLTSTLNALIGDPVLARSPLRNIGDDLLSRDQAITAITAAVNDADALLGEIDQAVIAAGLPETISTRMPDLEALVHYAHQVLPLASADLVELLNPVSELSRKFSQAVHDWRKKEKVLSEIRKDNGGWKKKIPAKELELAIGQAKKFETAFLPQLTGAYWRMRKVIHASYDFSRHAVVPTWVDILSGLEREYKAEEACEQAKRELVEVAQGNEPETLINCVEALARRVEPLLAAAQALHAYLVENPEATYLVEKLAGLQKHIGEVDGQVGPVVREHRTYMLPELRDEVRKVRADLVWLPDMLPVLLEVLRLPELLRRALYRLPLTDTQLEAAMAQKSLRDFYRQDRLLEAFDGRMLVRRIDQLAGYHREWIEVNAKWIKQHVRNEFVRKAQLSSIPASQLNGADLDLKEIYSAGRRELEHEFSKTQRRRSIRELADNETGIVIRDLKPIWLMSPLSVSDTIPLSSEAFDVVIFDEASQIPVEEAIPAIYRAQQIIVVGDEMQLPPTNFFSATRSTDPLLFDGGADDVSADDLDADSLLKQASINLPSTMLGWHYRSRSETLISYSNAAFYESQLMTIPDRQIAAEGLNEIIVTKSEDGIAHIEALLKRRVSFHFVPKAVYEQRRNRAEADYIAHLLKEMLAQETKLTLGVVAFSEAQQTEIESALERLSAKDSLFARRLEAEYEREDEGQFCGFFVKNLENVQGDERDIIILSICYGYDRNRRMLMNFGPINQQGGEKRLNVIFSRAREHMVVVSSIRHTDITNDYNDGANCLRNFLEYAHACSKGEGAAAQRVLRTISPQKMPRAQSDANDPVVLQLADALKARGFVVETQVGQSEFRLPLAIRRSSVDQHALGILVDDGVHYAQKDILERYLLRPEVLESFGWKVALVLTKDWYHDPEGVLRHLERAVSGASKPKSNLIAIASPSRSGSSSRSKGEAEGGKTATVVLEADDKTDSRSYRHFEMHENGVMKFWDIAADGNEIAVRFGRKSSNATVQTKTFSSAAEAGAELERLVRSKVAKGYVESTG